MVLGMLKRDVFVLYGQVMAQFKIGDILKSVAASSAPSTRSTLRCVATATSRRLPNLLALLSPQKGSAIS